MELNQMMSILRFNWDVPFRVAASVLTIALVIGAFSGRTALQVGSSAADYIVEGAGYSLEQAHQWIVDRSVLFVVIGSVLLLSIFFIGRTRRYRGAGRAPAAFLMGVWAFSEAGVGWLPLWIWGGVFAVWVVAFIARIVVLNVGRMADDYQLGEGARNVESWLRRTWFGPIVAAVYIPLFPLTWIFA